MAVKATFVGDPTQPKGTEPIPDVFEAYGLTFRKGEATEIPPHLEEKFLGNTHYKTTGEPSKPAA